jgi:hypothetical protein
MARERYVPPSRRRNEAQLAPSAFREEPLYLACEYRLLPQRFGSAHYASSLQTLEAARGEAETRTQFFERGVTDLRVLVGGRLLKRVPLPWAVLLIRGADWRTVAKFTQVPKPRSRPFVHLERTPTFLA